MSPALTRWAARHALVLLALATVPASVARAQAALSLAGGASLPTGDLRGRRENGGHFTVAAGHWPRPGRFGVRLDLTYTTLGARPPGESVDPSQQGRRHAAAVMAQLLAATGSDPVRLYGLVGLGREWTRIDGRTHPFPWAWAANAGAGLRVRVRRAPRYGVLGYVEVRRHVTLSEFGVGDYNVAAHRAYAAGVLVERIEP